MKEHYLGAISLIERLHRLFLEVIRYELDSMKVEDINNVQTMVLYNLGNDQISIGELTTRGCYLGSNVSYNLKKMVQNGYVEQMTSKHDKRSFVIKLSSKGALLCKRFDAVFDKHIGVLQESELGDMNSFISTLRELETFWIEASTQRSRFSIPMKKRTK